MRRFIAGLVIGFTTFTALNAAELEYSKTNKRDDVYIVDLSILVDVPEAYARNVLSDPDRFNQINAAVLEIEHLPPGNTGIRRFREKTSVCALFFCVTYQNIAQVRVLENRNIEVNVEPGGSDFEYGYVVWKTESIKGANSRISFHSETKPSFWVPPGLGVAVMGWQMEGIIYDAMSNMECEYQGKKDCYIGDDPWADDDGF